jgi:putative ATP-dependent endonuclease of the OLD family
MIINTSIKVKNYKCFGDEEQGFEKIYPLNIIIGKNNSGKSSLIDLIQHSFGDNEKLLNIENGFTKCIVNFQLNPEVIENVATNYAIQQGRIDAKDSWLESIKTILLNSNETDSIKLYIENNGNVEFITNANILGQFRDAFYIFLINFFRTKKFRRINAERDILKEMFREKIELNENGSGATNMIWKYLSIEGFDQNIIKKELLSYINQIVKPDIEFTDITIKEENIENRQGARGEIFFEDKSNSWIALSKMGSGVKTIILVLLNLIVLPEIQSIKRENYVFGFEELENNLHPSLQRRLFNFITEYAEINKCYFFITTHSNIVIDIFSHNKNAQLIHVETRGGNSVAKQVTTHFEQRNVLKDLDFKASDLLLSNGVIWVEGPSDAIYIELLLSLFKTTNENLINFNYCIQPLSTAIWKYAGFTDFDWEKVNFDELQNQIISLAKLNHNHLIVLDKDDNYEDIPPSKNEEFKNKTGQNKAKLIHESMIFANHDETNLENNHGESKDGKLLFWINDGTFETYLEHFIVNKGKEFSKYFSKHKTLNYFEKKRAGGDHSKSKVELATEIAQFVSNSDCSIYDLAPKGSDLLSKVEKLVMTIKSWNEVK